MTVFEAIILGLLQGLTEFLPVSSSGHLVIAQTLMGIQDVGVTFDVMLHFGTLISVLICFWHDIVEMVKEFFLMLGGLVRRDANINKNPMRRQMLMVILASIPMVAAVFFDDKVEALFSSTLVVGFMLLITAVMLVVTDIHGFSRKDASKARWSDALVVGVMQLFATIPGISRSGAAITGGALCGFSRSFAVRFAFIMSIPVILGANIFKLSEAFAGGLDTALILPCVVGVIVAAVSGVCAIGLMRYLVKRKTFKPFAVYCAAAGLITIILSFIF